jgi:hypothetical protein
VSTCVCPLFVFFDVEPEAYKLQIRYLINYVRIEVREIRTMKLMHGIYIHIYTYIHIYIYILYIYYAPGCILYRECTQAQRTEPSQANQASKGARGARADPLTAATAPHSPIGNHPPGPTLYNPLPVTLSFNSLTR